MKIIPDTVSSECLYKAGCVDSSPDEDQLLHTSCRLGLNILSSPHSPYANTENNIRIL